MSSRAHRPPPTTTAATSSAQRRESRLYDPQQAYYTDSQQFPSSSARKLAKPTKQRDHHPPPAASSHYYNNKNGYYSSYEQQQQQGGGGPGPGGMARPQSVAPSISSHRDYPTAPPARAPSVQPSLHHYSSHAQLPPARPPSTQPQQIARPPSRAAHGVAASVSMGQSHSQSQSQAQAWADYRAAGGTVGSTSYGVAPSTSAPGASSGQPHSMARPSTSGSINGYPSLFDGYSNGIDGYAASGSYNPQAAPSTSYGQSGPGHPYQHLTVPGRAKSSRHRDLEKDFDPSPQSSNERVVWQQQLQSTGIPGVAPTATMDDRAGPPPSAPIPIPGVARSTRHRDRDQREREREGAGIPIAPSTSYKPTSYEAQNPLNINPSMGYVIPPQGIAVAKSTRSVREKEREVPPPAAVAVAASRTGRREKERDRDRERGEKTDAEDERREERRRNRERERERERAAGGGDKTDAEDDRRRRERDRGGEKTDAEDDRRRDERRRERERERERDRGGEKTDAEDDRRREERRRERERERERATRERERETDGEDAYRRRKEREREERRRERDRRGYTDAEDDAAAARRREERRREREEEKRRDEEKRRERERERQEREREDERRREERERIRQERIRIENEERERRRRIQVEADYRAQLEAQAAAAATARAQAEAEEREREKERQRRVHEANARAEAEERERQKRAEQVELEERERQRVALIEQERKAAKAEAEERQRRMQAEADERHRRMQAEAAAARALAETQAREAEDQRRQQAEAQSRTQAEADAQSRARAEAEAQAAQAREQERQRRLQVEAEEKERHRQAFLEQQRQAAAAKAEAEEKQRRMQAEAAARAQAEAQEKQKEQERQERERQRRLRAQAEAEERERERQLAAAAKAEAEERQRRRQEEAEERERQRRIQAEERAKAEAEERERQRRIQAEAQAKAEAEEKERQRQAQAQARAQAEAEERERRRRAQAEAEERERQREAHIRAQAEAEERERQRQAHARAQAEAEERERQRQARVQAEAEERERQRQARAQAESEERERRRRAQAEAEERERQRQAHARAQAEAEERERQRQAQIRAQAEAEERERQRQAHARAQAEAEERERQRQARLQAEAEELDRQHQHQLRLAAEAQEREHQRRLQIEAEEREKLQRRQQAEAEERERRRQQAEHEERERQRRYQAEAEERDRQRRAQAEAEEKERHRQAFLEQQRQAAIAKADAEERQRRRQEEAEARERERMRQAAEERQKRLQAEAEERERQRQRAEAQARADAEEAERQRRHAEAEEKQRQLAEEWSRKEKERLAANTKTSSDMLWGPPPVPAKNSPPIAHPIGAAVSMSSRPSYPTPQANPSHRHTASAAAAIPSTIHQALTQASQQQQLSQDSPPLRVVDSNREKQQTDNSPRTRKRDSQLLNLSIPIVEKTGSGRYREKSSRPSVVPVTDSPSNQAQSQNQVSQIPSSAPAQMLEFGANPYTSSRDTLTESGPDRHTARDKRHTSRQPEPLPLQQLPQLSRQAELEPPSNTSRLAALMTHTDSNTPYFQRKLSKDSLAVNPNMSGFLIPPSDISRNRRPSTESEQYPRIPISAPAAMPSRSHESISHHPLNTQLTEVQPRQEPTYEAQLGAHHGPVLPLHPPSILTQTSSNSIEPLVNPLKTAPQVDVQGPMEMTHELQREHTREREIQLEPERARIEQEIVADQERERQRRDEEDERRAESNQGKVKKGRKETKKEKARAKEEKKREKEREKEKGNLTRQISATQEELDNGTATIKGKSGSAYRGIPEFWKPGRPSQDERPANSSDPNRNDNEVQLDASNEPISATSTVKQSKKERRHRRHVSFSQGQDKGGQESSSEQELTSGTWGKGSLRGLFKNDRNLPEDGQVSSTDTDQDPEAAKRQKRRTSSRLHEGFSAAVEASAKLASMLVPGRGNRSRKSSMAHEEGVDREQPTAGRFSQERLMDDLPDAPERQTSQDTNTIPFPQPTIPGRGPIISAPILTPFGEGPELIVPRSPVRGVAHLPSSHNTSQPIPTQIPPSVNPEHEHQRMTDAQRLAALIDVAVVGNQRSRAPSLVPTTRQPETAPVASYFDPAATHSRNGPQQPTNLPPINPDYLPASTHHNDHVSLPERQKAQTYVSAPAMYYGNTIARPPTMAPPEPERPTLPTSISYSSTTVEASSRSGPSVTQSSSSFAIPTLSQFGLNPITDRVSENPQPSSSTDQNLRPRNPSVSHGDTSMIAQLLSRPPPATSATAAPPTATQPPPLTVLKETPRAAQTEDSQRPKDLYREPVNRPEEQISQAKSTTTSPPYLQAHRSGNNLHGSREHIQRPEPPSDSKPPATEVPLHPPPISTFIQPSLSMPMPSVPVLQSHPTISAHVSSTNTEAPRVQPPQPLVSAPLPQQPAVSRAKEITHSRQNSQDSLIEAGSKSSPHDNLATMTSAAKGSPLAKRNGSQDAIVYPPSFKPSSLQDTLTTKDSPQPSLPTPSTAITSTTTAEQSSSRPDTTSKTPNLLSVYPESRSRAIPSNVQPVSLLSATAPIHTESNPKNVTATSNNTNTNARVRAPPPEAEIPQPLSSSYSTRPPNSHHHSAPPAPATTVQPSISAAPEKAALAPAPGPIAASSSRQISSNPPSSRPPEERLPPPLVLAPPPASTPSRPHPSSSARPPEVPVPTVPATRPSEKPSHNARSASQPVIPTGSFPSLASRSQEEVVPAPTPLTVPPVRSTQTMAPTSSAADRKPSAIPHAASASTRPPPPDPDAEPPAPATKSKVDRSPITQLRQNSDPALDTKAEPAQPVEPTTRRVRPLRGVSDQGPHRTTAPGQTVTVQVTPDASRRDRRDRKERETTKKKGLFGGIFGRSSRDTREREHVATAEKPMTDSNESLPESMHRLRPVESAPATMTPMPLIPVATVVSRAEEKQEMEIVAPIPVHGNGKPLSKRHAPFRVTAKRYRTVSQASIDAADGNTVSVIMSGADSIRSSTAGRPSPPLRDPIAAAIEWRNLQEAAHQDRGKRRRRPGVVFDVDVEEEQKEKVPSKLVRRGTRGRLTKPPPDSAGRD